MKTPLTLMIVASIAALALTVSGKRLHAARDEVASAHAQFTATKITAKDVLRLRGRDEVIASDQKPREDVLALVNEVLAASGLPSQSLISLDPHKDEALGQGSSRYRRQKLMLHLDRLAPEQLGAFLAQWRDRQGMWVPSQIELTHIRAQEDPKRLYAVKLLIEATYLAEALNR